MFLRQQGKDYQKKRKNHTHDSKKGFLELYTTTCNITFHQESNQNVVKHDSGGPIAVLQSYTQMCVFPRDVVLHYLISHRYY